MSPILPSLTLLKCVWAAVRPIWSTSASDPNLPVSNFAVFELTSRTAPSTAAWRWLWLAPEPGSRLTQGTEGSSPRGQRDRDPHASGALNCRGSANCSPEKDKQVRDLLSIFPPLLLHPPPGLLPRGPSNHDDASTAGREHRGRISAKQTHGSAPTGGRESCLIGRGERAAPGSLQAS